MGFEGPETVASPSGPARPFRARPGLPASSWTSTGHVIGLGASGPGLLSGRGRHAGHSMHSPCRHGRRQRLWAQSLARCVFPWRRISASPPRALYRVMAGEVVRDFQIEEESIAFHRGDAASIRSSSWPSKPEPTKPRYSVSKRHQRRDRRGSAQIHRSGADCHCFRQAAHRPLSHYFQEGIKSCSLLKN